MKLTFIRLALAFVLITTFHCSCVSSSAALQSTLGGNMQLSGINTLLNSAGGLKNLMGKGNKPFTFLAPTNNALVKLGPGTLENLLKPENKEQLIGILKKHALPGKFKADQIKAGGIKDILGNELNLGGANILETIHTKSGLVQVIDKVIQ
jgi:uncharacterized surface protein with fasciclin (FAS1) repeats